MHPPKLTPVGTDRSSSRGSSAWPSSDRTGNASASTRSDRRGAGRRTRRGCSAYSWSLATRRRSSCDVAGHPRSTRAGHAGHRLGEPARVHPSPQRDAAGRGSSWTRGCGWSRAATGAGRRRLDRAHRSRTGWSAVAVRTPLHGCPGAGDPDSGLVGGHRAVAVGSPGHRGLLSVFEAMRAAERRVGLSGLPEKRRHEVLDSLTTSGWPTCSRRCPLPSASLVRAPRIRSAPRTCWRRCPRRRGGPAVGCPTTCPRRCCPDGARESARCDGC